MARVNVGEADSPMITIPQRSNVDWHQGEQIFMSYILPGDGVLVTSGSRDTTSVFGHANGE